MKLGQELLDDDRIEGGVKPDAANGVLGNPRGLDSRRPFLLNLPELATTQSLEVMGEACGIMGNTVAKLRAMISENCEVKVHLSVEMHFSSGWHYDVLRSRLAGE